MATHRVFFGEIWLLLTVTSGHTVAQTLDVRTAKPILGRNKIELKKARKGW